jgi:hypothetical protein
LKVEDHCGNEPPALINDELNNYWLSRKGLLCGFNEIKL